MTSSRTRLGVLSGVFLAGLCIVLLHLWFLMVQDQEVWALRSYENRSAFRSVPSQRGMLLDRDGELLAWDEPTTKVSVYYRRFRLYHVVGAAVHGATYLASLQPARSGTTYNYQEGVLGPRSAVEDLLAVPVTALQQSVLDKAEFTTLITYATTVLSGCSGLPRNAVYGAMRRAAQAGLAVGIGDVLPQSRAELLGRFETQLQRLYELDRLLLGQQQQHNELLGRTTVDPTLLEVLEKLRRQSLAGDKITWRELDDDGEEKIREGSLFEDMRRYVAQDVRFELAAALRVDRASYPGIEVEPAIRRMRRGARETSLGLLIGDVVANDRRIPKQPDATDATASATISATVSAIDDDYGMPEQWREELVPDEVVANDIAREHMRREAERRYQREQLVNERSGVSGMEALCDEDLTGRLGMRFVEHDSRSREHRLWSNLRVESGDNAQVTIDCDLQDAAEDVVRDMDRANRADYDLPVDLHGLEASLAIIDAHSGDILAVAGAPLSGKFELDQPEKPMAPRVPGLRWLQNGSIGSVVKPFILLEHLESERLGRPYLDVQQMLTCTSRIKLGGIDLKCDNSHYDAGRSPVSALAQSCNLFFYQAGMGLQQAGVQRALERFGLSEPKAGDDFFACWQPRIRGLSIAVPRVDGSIFLARRAIGYGVQVPPLYVARAFAGIATGVLPELGMRLEPRTQVSLGPIAESLAVVREGLAECVLSGTGRKLDLLKELQVHARTGTAEISSITKQNNAWFAGYIPWTGQGGMQLVFCGVVYRVRPGSHGADTAGQMVVNFLRKLEANPELRARYLTPAGGR